MQKADGSPEPKRTICVRFPLLGGNFTVREVVADTMFITSLLDYLGPDILYVMKRLQRRYARAIGQLSLNVDLPERLQAMLPGSKLPKLRSFPWGEEVPTD